jgi:hypothetical protein
MGLLLQVTRTVPIVFVQVTDPVDPDYPKSDRIGFDPAYMQQLFDHGYQRGRVGVLWRSTPAAPPPSLRVARQ